MTYRDDGDAMRARIEQLERENRALREQGAAPRLARPVPVGESGAWLLGGPKVVRSEGAIDGELSGDAHERLLDVLRSRFSTAGETSVIGKTLSWKTSAPRERDAMTPPLRAIEAMATALDGKTTIRVIERLDALVTQRFFGTFLAATVLPLGMVLFFGVPFRDLGGASMVMAIGLVLAILASRAVYRVSARARSREIQSVADELIATARAATTTAAPAVRIGIEDDARDDAEAEADVPAAARLTAPSRARG